MIQAEKTENATMHHRAHLASVLALSLLATLSLSDAAFACVYMSPEALNAVEEARIYTVVSTVIGVAIVGTEIVRQRYTLSLVLASAYVVFHPAWINPGRGDCGTGFVHSSQTALAVMILLLTVQLLSLRFSRLGRKSPFRFSPWSMNGPRDSRAKVITIGPRTRR